MNDERILIISKLLDIGLRAHPFEICAGTWFTVLEPRYVILYRSVLITASVRYSGDTQPQYKLKMTSASILPSP